jgi:hypothetical protein
MKIYKKIVAIVLSAIIALSVSAVPIGAVDSKTSSVKSTQLLNIVDNGYPMPDIGQILQGYRALNKVFNNILGVPLFNDKCVVITADSMIQGFVDYIYNESGVDFSKVYENLLPQTNQYSEWLTTTFNIDIPAVQEQLNKLSAEYYEKGQLFPCFMTRWLSVWLGVIDKCELSCVPVEGSDSKYLLAAVLTYRDGRKDVLTSNVYYDSTTNQFTGSGDGGALLGFDMDISKCMTYNEINVWQRKAGFCLFYDIFCYTTPYLNYSTQRIKFNYDSREWMIQLWKGRYFITNGGEVGIYTRSLGSIGSYYNCASDDDMLTMSLDIYHGDKQILHRDPTLHWWITGFAISNTTYLPCTLTLISTITMKDEEMLKAFTKSLDKKKCIMKYTVSGLNVTITW